jgi:lipopolysaccharide export system permease protein
MVWHYDLTTVALPSVDSDRDATLRELLTISLRRHGMAILLTDQTDGSERVSRLEIADATEGDPPKRGWSWQAFRIAGCGNRAVTMGSIDKYIFRTTLASFALVLVSLTGVIWITQALRSIDLMTSQGQTILTFLGVTSLVIPSLVLIISPIALMIAISHNLNKLATDSEIIVMNAAGLSPFRLFRPFLYATLVVAIMVAFIASYFAPDGLRRLKQWDSEITADVLANILQPGRFAQLDQNLTIRIRERQPGGLLVGIFVDDRRDPNERVSIVADHGTVVKNEGGSFLILEDGNLERLEVGKHDPALVVFGRYAFDMSKFSNQGHDVTLGIRERYLWELLSPPIDDPVYTQLPGQFRAELHDRFLAPIYPFAFAALTFAFLGAPRTTRQSRNFSMTSSILAVFGLRMAGFACSVMAVKTPLAALVQYLMLALALGGSLWLITGDVIVEPPAALVEAITKLNVRLVRLFGRPVAA